MTFKAFYEDRVITERPEEDLPNGRPEEDLPNTRPEEDLPKERVDSSIKTDMSDPILKTIATHPYMIDAIKTVYSMHGAGPRKGEYDPELAVGMLKNAAKTGGTDPESFIETVVDFLQKSIARGKGREVHGLETLSTEILSDIADDLAAYKAKNKVDDTIEPTTEPIEDKTMDNDEVQPDVPEEVTDAPEATEPTHTGPFTVSGLDQTFDTLEAAIEAANGNPVYDADGNEVDGLTEDCGGGAGTPAAGPAPGVTPGEPAQAIFASRLGGGIDTRRKDMYESIQKSVGDLDFSGLYAHDKTAEETEDRRSENVDRRKESIVSLRDKIKGVLTELDAVLEEDDDIEPVLEEETDTMLEEDDEKVVDKAVKGALVDFLK